MARKALFSAIPTWNDNDRCPVGTQRLLQWRFYKNKALVFQTPFAAPEDALAIGTGSTYLHLNATNAQITAYLISQGVVLSNSDTVCVEVQIKNCQNESARSNKICFAAEVAESDCTCEFATAFDSGQTGNTATPPLGYAANGGQLVFSNGLMNPEGEDFSAMPLDTGDNLAWVTLDENCDATIEMEEVTGQTGTVEVPAAFTGLPASDYLVFRNGAAQRTFSVSAGNLTPNGPASESTDLWHFVRLQSADSCKLSRLTISASGTGTTFMLPAGYSAANQAKWLLFVNELLQYPTLNYTVAGNQITPAQAAAEDQIWVVVIH
ncbi:MAG: hypothetical protein IPM98_20660 [Lewinellaceae bacterium]|nr:hypothetical protein [Lewinellaceae bacterium]